MKLKNQAGFTLMEIMIVVGIIAIGYATVLFFGFGGKSQLRQETKNLMHKIRYVYQLASTESRYYRIVFDIDAGQYSFEVSDDPSFVQTEKDEDEKTFADKIAEDDVPTDDDTAPAEPEASFAESEDELLEPYILDKEIKIYSVFVEHQKASVDLGQASLNFFPRGQTEFAVIQLSDLDEEHFMTLQINPTTGSAQIYDELKDYETILEELQE